MDHPLVGRVVHARGIVGDRAKRLPPVAILGFVLFDENLGRWTVLGTGIVFVANAYIASRSAAVAAATTAPVEAANPGE